MLDFLASYWWVILIFVVLVLLFFALRGLRRALKERENPFNVETVKKYSQPNFQALQQKSKALLADADMVCEIQPGKSMIVPKKEDVKFFRRAVSQKYKLAMFLVPGTNKVVYFFCKTEAGLKRRFENLVINQKYRDGKKPYLDVATGEKLKFPRMS